MAPRPEIQLQLRRDLAATWTSVNPILAQGEMGVEYDTLKIKVGNGIDVWTALPYIQGDTSEYTNYLNTTGAAVNVSEAAPPTAGQVLTATDATHATWQDLGDDNHYHSVLKTPDGTATGFSVDENGNLVNSNDSPRGALHLHKTTEVVTTIENRNTGSDRDESYIGSTGYWAFASDDTTSVEFARVAAATKLVGDGTTDTWGKLSLWIQVNGFLAESFVIEPKDNGIGGTQPSFAFLDTNGEAFARFNGHIGGLRIGKETTRDYGILQLCSGNNENSQVVISNVGLPNAYEGLFVRRGEVYEREDVGELSDDGVLQIANTNGYVGIGFVWMSDAGGYDDHITSVNFVFDMTGIRFYDSHGEVATTDTDGKLCLYDINEALFIKNRLGFKAMMGYTVKFFDNFQLVAPAVELTWTETAEDGDWRDVTMSHDGTKIFASPFYGISRASTDSGANWSNVSDFINTKYASTNVMNSSGVYRLAGGAAPNDPKPLYLSTDSGANFGTLTKTTGTLTNVTFNATTRKIIRSSGSFVTNGFTAGMQIYITGSTKLANNDVFIIQSVTATEITLISGSVLVTDTTAGESIVIKAMEERWKGCAISDNGATMIAAAQGQGRGIVAVSTDSGTTWTTKLYGDFRDCCCSADGAIMFAVTYTGYVLKSINSGSTWTDITSIIGKRAYSSVCCSDDGTKVLVGGYSGYFYWSADTGANWSNSTGTSIGTGQWRSCAMSTDGVEMILCSYSGKVAFSNDSGSNWELQSVPTHNWIGITMNAAGTLVAVVSEDPDRSIYIGSV